MTTTTHKIRPTWAISFGMRRAAAAKAQASDLLLLSARNAAHDTTPRPVERLPFNPPNKPNLSNVGKFYWKRGLCALSDGVERIFIYNQLGLPMATAETEEQADDMVYRLNHADYSHITCPF